MARLPRLYAPATVQHAVQRPAAGRVLFADPDDYAFFVGLMAEAVHLERLALHAYVLLPDQVRLLATPARADSLGRVMQAVGRRYVPYLNRKTARSGPLWDRRYRSTLIDADALLFASMRYIECLPVVEGLVAGPGDWRWSSYGHHVGREQQPFVSDHAHYWGLSDTPFERQALYRDRIEVDIDGAVGDRIAEAVDRGWAIGGVAFVGMVDGIANRRSAPLARGRKRLPGK